MNAGFNCYDEWFCQHKQSSSQERKDFAYVQPAWTEICACEKQYNTILDMWNIDWGLRSSNIVY